MQVGADDDLPVVVHAGAGNGGTGQLGNLHLQLCLHGLGQRRAVGDKNRAGQLVVLGLAQQICRHPGGVAAAVGQHQDLAGAGDQDVYKRQADSPSTTFVGLANASTTLVWLGVIAYSLQLYIDFSGYSMMAIGMGKMLGFDFPQHFNFPYLSRSITEFWRRWHMTLSGWFREYVYIPVSYTHLPPASTTAPHSALAAGPG